MTDQEHPDLGDACVMRAAGRVTSALAADVARLRGQVTAAGGVAGVQAWSGAAGLAWRSAVTDVGNGLVPVVAGLDLAAAALGAYATALDRIGPPAVAARRQLAQAAAELRLVTARLHGTTVDPAQHARDLAAVTRWQQQRSAALAMLRRLALDRDAADAACCAGLAGAVPRQASQLRAALAAVGVDRPDQLTVAALSDALVALARRLTDADQASPDDMAEMTALLQQCQDDPIVMARFLREAGGRRVSALVALVGADLATHGPLPPAVTALLESLRHGIVTGSSRLDAAQARDFATGLFCDTANAATVISYLLGGAAAGTPHDLVSANLVVAIADQLDLLMRSPDSNAAPMIAHDWGLLADVTRQEGVVGDPRSLASRVFLALAAYPDRARQWFAETGADVDGPVSSSSIGDARVDYWFGQADWTWSTNDGFETVAALWRAITSAAPGPVEVWNAGVGVDRGAVETVAHLQERIWAALAHHPGYVPGALTDDAARGLVTVVSPQLVALAVYPMSSDSVGAEAVLRAVLTAGATPAVDASRGWLTGASRRAADPETPALPQVVREDADQVLGVLASNGVGARQLVSAVSASQGLLIRQTAAMPAEDRGLMLKPVAALQGVLDGCPDGAERRVIAGRADRAQSMVTVAGAVAGVVTSLPPFPPLISGGISLGLSWGGHELADFYDDRYADQLAAVGDIDPALQEAAARDALMALAHDLQIGDPELAVAMAMESYADQRAHAAGLA